jgi:hypothetical protein
MTPMATVKERERKKVIIDPQRRNIPFQKKFEEQ